MFNQANKFAWLNMNSKLALENLMERNKTIKIRVSESELAQLNHQKTQVQLASWMREVCLGTHLKKAPPPPPVDPDLLRQLAAIGNNLNQVARKINTNEWSPDDRARVISHLIDIEEALGELRVSHSS